MSSEEHDPSSCAPVPSEAAPGGAAQRLKGGSFRVVGIGASAGGLDAFTKLLSHLPPRTGMAFVLVQHLDPLHPSLLANLLSKVTSMPVVEATDGLGVQRDHVYVIPPNVNMAIASGLLHLTPRGSPHALHLPVDFFFRSLAREYQSRAIGVVLSGTGSDGTLGISEINAAGGMTFAQEEKSAPYGSMPRNAIHAGCVSAVLAPEAIAHELARMGRDAKYRPVRATPTAGGAQGANAKIISLLRAAHRVDFGAYRDTTIKRRIARRMAVQNQPSLEQYAQFLESSPAEVEALYREILISVTGFFRDAEVFAALKTHIFPQIIKSKASHAPLLAPPPPIRIWVPGCSTGQEAYSLAIALLEVLEGQIPLPPIQIFGTDINEPGAIEKARLGLYPHKIESEVSAERLARFFTREANGYRISSVIREMCIFARQNVVVDPPFSRLDLISCRNLLIYLSAPLQKQVIPTFHYALNPGGFLVLGTSETIGRFTDLFDMVSKENAIYRRSLSAAARTAGG